MRGNALLSGATDDALAKQKFLEQLLLVPFVSDIWQAVKEAAKSDPLIEAERQKTLHHCILHVVAPSAQLQNTAGCQLTHSSHALHPGETQTTTAHAEDSPAKPTRPRQDPGQVDSVSKPADSSGDTAGKLPKRGSVDSSDHSSAPLPPKKRHAAVPKDSCEIMAQPARPDQSSGASVSQDEKMGRRDQRPASVSYAKCRAAQPNPLSVGSKRPHKFLDSSFLDAL